MNYSSREAITSYGDSGLHVVLVFHTTDAREMLLKDLIEPLAAKSTQLVFVLVDRYVTFLQVEVAWREGQGVRGKKDPNYTVAIFSCLCRENFRDVARAYFLPRDLPDCYIIVVPPGKVRGTGMHAHSNQWYGM